MRAVISRARRAAARRLRAAPQVAARRRLRRQIASSPPPTFDMPRVFYGLERLPARDEPATAGGFVKFQRLAASFPNDPEGFNLFYSGSSSLLPDFRELVAVAQARGARVVWNQNGVLYPGLGLDLRPNECFAFALQAAAHVFFQTEFCKLSADRMLGEPSGSWEVLPNAVDTTVFAPAQPPDAGLVLLLGGNQNHWYRVDAALQTAAIVAREREDVTLVVAGGLSWASDPGSARRQALARVRELGIERHVELTGRYRQSDAPDLYRRAHVLLHTQYNDACPNTVIEAMACGLPIVYSASGGAPELVGPDAGIGVPAPLDFERVHPPDPQALAEAVLEVAARREQLASAARRRAVERFDLQPWIERHRCVFEELLE